MELMIDIWKIGCFAILAFISMRLIIVFAACKGYCSPSEQIYEIMHKWCELQKSGDALFGKTASRYATPVAIGLIFLVIILLWPVIVLYMIAR